MPASRRSRPGGQELLAELIGLAYDAALDEERWPAFLTRLARALDAVCPGLNVAGSGGGGHGLWFAPEQDPAWLAAYEAHFVRLDLRRPRIQALAAGSVFVGQRLVDDAALVRSEFYQDFLRPQGYFHILGAVPLNDEDRTAVLRVIRPPGARPFGAAQERVLGALVPHVRRSLQVHAEMASARASAAGALAALDRFPTGVVTLDERGRIVGVNRKGEAVLAAGDGLTQEGGRLAARHPAAHAELAALLARAARREPAPHGGTMLVPRRDGRPPLELLVTPAREAPAALGDRAAVLVFVADREHAVAATPATVARLLRITPAEARLALAVAHGSTLDEAAIEFGISPHTARTQMKQALAKTGTRRQSDLVRLIVTGCAALVQREHGGRRAGAGGARAISRAGG
ncbi:MAG: helix-turn-helix transcriptional regulator [Thermodesulfobacteriota bacterium]